MVEKLPFTADKYENIVNGIDQFSALFGWF